jgi:CDP-6-deoxy-D-xylo-4-hexulose-3-dehydrase
MSKKTLNFENNFAKKIGAKYAIMVNSGSSANLLSVAAACNPLFKNKLNYGDEVLIPALCWPTSLWPLVQYGLKPIFVDIDKETLNISIEDINKKITKKTKAIMCIHILGLSSDIEKIRNIAKKKKLILFEDTCESLGSKFKQKNLGTFGEFGTFSFYYSHQITSGEGGMIVTNSRENYNILKTLRSHGWSRDTSFHKYFQKKYKKIDKRFLFINSGYNLRPTEVQAAMANNQLKRLSKLNMIRKYNRTKIINQIKKINPKYTNLFKFLEVPKNINPSFFGLIIILNIRFKYNKIRFLNYLTQIGIENRCILTGNFLNQPAAALYKLNKKNLTFKNTQAIDELGFFIGLHSNKISSSVTKFLAKSLLKISDY